MRALAIGGAAVALALALVWYLGPDAQRPLGLGGEPQLVSEPSFDAQASSAPAAQASSTAGTAAADVRSGVAGPAGAELPESAASSAPLPERAPLPGETPATPMTQLIADRQNNVIIRETERGGGVPPGLTKGELDFAAEPVDAAWAPGAEADILAKLAQMPGLKLIDLQVECRSTMCRLQLTQPRQVRAQGTPASAPSRGPLDLLHDNALGLEARWLMAIGDGTGPTRLVAYLWREGYARRDCYKDGISTPCSDEADQSGN